MSHFICLVIPDDKGLMPSRVEKKLESIMGPYNENLNVKEYERDCYCVGREAERAGHDHADRVCGSIDDLRVSFHRLHKTPKSPEKPYAQWTDEEKRQVARHQEAADAAWDLYLKPHRRAQKVFTKKHPLYQKPDATCDECKGTGKHMSTSNPKGYWDWLEVGGRWDGAVHYMATGKERPVNLVRITKGNYKKFHGYAVVDARGKWHAHGQMGWFGSSSDLMSEKRWLKHQNNLFKKHIGHLVIGVDCHT